MTQKPLISIVMGAYNRLEFLKIALESARNAVDDIPHEIIIVDGGSDDGSLEWLIHQKDVVTIVQHNRGTFNNKSIPRRSWGYFMNLAFKSAQADYILMMSDDTIFHADAVKNGLAFIQEQQATGKNIGAVPFYFHDVDKEPPDHYKIFTLFDVPMLNHGIYVRQALATVGYADEESFLFYGADSDICFRLRHAGYEIIPCPTALMIHCENHPLRLMNTPSDTWLQDMSALMDKWRGIFIPSDVTMIPDKPTTQTIIYHDPNNLRQVFDTVLAQTDSTHINHLSHDEDIVINQIEARLQSLLKATQYNIVMTQKTHTYLMQSRLFFWRWLMTGQVFRILRQIIKKRLANRTVDGVALPPIAGDEAISPHHILEMLQVISAKVDENRQLTNGLYRLIQRGDKE